MKRLLAIAVVLALAGSESLAAPRTWKSSNGRFTTEAELLDYKEGKATLKKIDGTEIEVPLLALSAEDREYVKQQFPGVQEEQVRPGAEFREWTSANGMFSTVAEFLGSSEGKVELRKLDGSEVSVDQELLSEADQQWIADEVRRRREEGDDGSADRSVESEITGKIDAQNIPMKLVRIEPRKAKDPSKGTSRTKSMDPKGYLFQATRPQQFYMQAGRDGGPSEADFRRVVSQEPEYKASVPFRAVARLGSRQYGFALDKKSEKSKGYDRLHFDLDGNGDLTDDEPISTAAITSANVTVAQFPRADLSIDVGGQPVDYAFVISAVCQKSAASSDAIVSLYSAAVREGYVTQGTRRSRLLLLDHNSNGRFNDAAMLPGAGRVLEGDLLLINPSAKSVTPSEAAMAPGYVYVGRRICLARNFYSMEVSPAGDNLRLSPLQVPMGNVANPSPNYRATLHNDEYGIIVLSGKKDQECKLPVGKWNITNYTINAFGSAGSARGFAAATFTGATPTVTVSEGETVSLPFGTPFRATVAARRANNKQVYLSLAIVGAGGEQCTNLYVNGKRPAPPSFAIKDGEGKTVHEGRFEYG